MTYSGQTDTVFTLSSHLGHCYGLRCYRPITQNSQVSDPSMNDPSALPHFMTLAVAISLVHITEAQTICLGRCTRALNTLPVLTGASEHIKERINIMQLRLMRCAQHITTLLPSTIQRERKALSIGTHLYLLMLSGRFVARSTVDISA